MRGLIKNFNLNLMILPVCCLPHQSDPAMRHGVNVEKASIRDVFFRPFNDFLRLVKSKTKTNNFSDSGDKELASTFSTPNHLASQLEAFDEVHLTPINGANVTSKPASTQPVKSPSAAAGLQRQEAAAESWKQSERWKEDELKMLNKIYIFCPEFSKKYRLKQLIGEGSFGFAWIAKRLSDHVEVAQFTNYTAFLTLNT